MRTCTLQMRAFLQIWRTLFLLAEPPTTTMSRLMAITLVACLSGPLSIFGGGTTVSEDPLVRRIEAVRVPKIDIADATSEEIIEFVRIKFRDWDPEREPARRGVSFLVVGPLENKEHLKYSASQISFATLLGELSSLLKLNIHITNIGIVLTAPGKAPFPNGKAQTGKILKSYHPADSKRQRPRDGATAPE